MKAAHSRHAWMLACLILAAIAAGCRSSAMRRDTARTPAEASAPVIANRAETEVRPTRDLHWQASKTTTQDIQLTSHDDESTPPPTVQATSWGVQVASLARVPDVTVNFSWFFMDDNRPPTSVVNVGEYAWSLGASVNLPLWADKYNSMEHEAGFRHAAAHATIDDLRRRYDTLPTLEVGLRRAIATLGTALARIEQASDE